MMRLTRASVKTGGSRPSRLRCRNCSSVLLSSPSERGPNMLSRVLDGDLLAGGVIGEGRAIAQRVAGRPRSASGIVQGGGAIAQGVDGCDQLAGVVIHARGAIGQRVNRGHGLSGVVEDGGAAIAQRVNRRDELSCIVVDEGGPAIEGVDDGVDAAAAPAADGPRVSGGALEFRQFAVGVVVHLEA